MECILEKRCFADSWVQLFHFDMKSTAFPSNWPCQAIAPVPKEMAAMRFCAETGTWRLCPASQAIQLSEVKVGKFDPQKSSRSWPAAGPTAIGLLDVASRETLQPAANCLSGLAIGVEGNIFYFHPDFWGNDPI